MAPTLNASPASPNGPTTYTSGPNPNRSGTNTGVSDPRDLLHGMPSGEGVGCKGGLGGERGERKVR